MIQIGCVTITRFKETERRLSKLEQDLRALSMEQERLHAKIERLYERMKKAEEGLRKKGANLGADVEALRAEVARLRGSTEELSFSLQRTRDDVSDIKKVLDQKLGIPVVKIPEEIENDPKKLLVQARSNLKLGKTAVARAMAARLLDVFPNDPGAPEAQYLLGASYLAEGKCAKAIREFQRVHDRFRDDKRARPLVGDALLGIVVCLAKQKQCKKARGVLKYLMSLDRRLPQAKKARSILKKWGKKKSCPL